MPCPLLESGVLSVLLHHPALISSHSDICKLLCCSADLNVIIHAHCSGLVTLTATQRVPPDWVKKYAPLLRCLRINFSKMCAADRAAAEGSLASALQHASLAQPGKNDKLRLGEFVSLHDRVNLELLKRLPVASLTRLVFTDAPDKRHKEALHRKRHAKHHAQHAPAAAAVAPAAAAAAAAVAAPAAPVANGAAAAGGEPAAAAAPAAAAPAVAPGSPGAEPAAPAGAEPAAAGAAQPAAVGAAPEAVPQAASPQQKKRKGHRPPRVTGLQELAATCRQLAGLREIEVTTIDGYADFLLPQLAFLKQLTSIKLDAVLSPNKALSTAAPKRLRALSLTFKSTRGNAQPQHKLDLSKCKMLSRLVLADGLLSAGDVLPESLNHLQVGLCTSLQPLLPLQQLQCLVVTGKKGSGDAFAAASQDLVQLRALTQLRLMSEALPPEACLPTRLVELHLDSLKDSMKQLTGLQCLTRLQVGLLDVPPSALEPLSALTSLAHISASILFPPLAGEAARLAAVLRPAPDQDLRPYLERIVSLHLPFVELSVQGAVLDPRAMQLVGQCRHLTKLQLQGCKGRMGDSWPTLDPFRCLSDPISTWTQLQSLSFRGDTWRIPYPLPPGTRLGELSRAELDALCAGLDPATARSVKLDAMKDKVALMTVQLLAKEAGSEATRAVAEAIMDAEEQGLGGTDDAAEAAMRSAVRAAVPARAYGRIGAAALDAVAAAAAAVGVDPVMAVALGAATAADAFAIALGHHTAAAGQAEQAEQAEQALAEQHDAAADAAGRAPGAGSSGASTSAAAAAAGSSAAAAAAPAGPSPEAREMLAQAISTDTLLEWSGWAKAMAASVGCLTRLTHLDLSSWSLGESVTGLRPLARLRDLNLQGTSQSDFSLLGLLPRLARLTQLSVACNLEVTRAPLAAMELLLPELRVLNVRRCVLMEGDRGFKDWVAQHPHLTVVTKKSMAV